MRLTPQQQLILNYIVEREGEIIATKAIANWLADNHGYTDVTPETVKVQLYNIREKAYLGEYELTTIRGIIYRRKNVKVSS